MKINQAFSKFGFYIVFAPQAAGSPFIDKCFTHEKEEPFRRGKGFLIRLPFKGKKPTIGLVIGKWENK